MVGLVQSEREALLACLAKAVRKGGMMIYWDHASCHFAYMKQKDAGHYREEMFMLRDYILQGHICHIEEGKKLKLGDVRLYPLLFEFNGKKCQAQRLLRRGKIRKQDQQGLTPYFFRDRQTRKLVFHWLTARVCKKTESSLEEGGDAEKITVLLNSYALREMFLNNNKIRAKGTQNIVNSLLVNQRLHEVHQIDNIAVMKDIEASPSNSPKDSFLKNQTLRENFSRREQNQRQGRRTLQKLMLGRNKIGDEGASSLANSFFRNGSLESVSLDHNKIGDTGARSLALSIVANTSLREVFLGRNFIGDQGAESLLAALKCNKVINTLQLDGNAITTIAAEDAVRDLLADPSREAPNDAMSSLEQLVKFVAKKDEQIASKDDQIASLKADLADPEKQLKALLASKDARISALEAKRANKRRRSNDEVVLVSRDVLRKQHQNTVRVKQEKNAAEGAKRWWTIPTGESQAVTRLHWINWRCSLQKRMNGVSCTYMSTATNGSTPSKFYPPTRSRVR